MKNSLRKRQPGYSGLGVALTLAALTVVCGSAGAGEALPKGALMGSAIVGFDIEPTVQFGASVDGYLRLTKRFSLGLRAGFIGAVDKWHDPPLISQIPLALLLSWDFILRDGRILVPLTVGTGISLLPYESDRMFLDLITIETGVKIRLAHSLWIAVTAGTRFRYFYYFDSGPYMPYSDFLFTVGPYVRF